MMNFYGKDSSSLFLVLFTFCLFLFVFLCCLFVMYFFFVLLLFSFYLFMFQTIWAGQSTPKCFFKQKAG